MCQFSSYVLLNVGNEPLWHNEERILMTYSMGSLEYLLNQVEINLLGPHL